MTLGLNLTIIALKYFLGGNFIISKKTNLANKIIFNRNDYWVFLTKQFFHELLRKNIYFYKKINGMDKKLH
jgi:hypothetical protein